MTMGVPGMSAKATIEKVLTRFRVRIVMTLAELALLMRCSSRTVYRRLQEWQAIHSYNKNGRYYVLPSVPTFDTHGLWRYRDIGFSRYGNLTETLIALVRNSQVGLGAAELGRLLGMEPRSFLSLFRNHPALIRERHHGRFVYFAAEPVLYRRQRDGRMVMVAHARRPSDSEVIAILVEAIKHPDWSLEQLCRHLTRQGLHVTEQAVSNLFVYHGLDIKKNGTFGLIRCLSDQLNRLVGQWSPASLFAQPPTVHFGPEQVDCPHCRGSLKVLKTKGRSVVTLHIGRFNALETIQICDGCRRTCGSQELARLVPPGCNFGYDILVHVGQALFLRHRRSQEISDELAAQNVRISPSEVEYLAKKFIVYLAIAHRQAAPAIKQTMHAHGGYILHLDATCDGKEPFLMSSLDSISEIVLGNVKLPSEKAETIVPFLEQIKQLFGEPIASVHDMGAGILRAVGKVFPGRPDFICHYHFLRDIGKDLLEQDYDTIRKRLHQHGIAGKLRTQARKLKQLIDNHPQLIDDFRNRVEQPSACDSSLELIPAISAYGLVLWALDGKNQGDGYGFPFDRPHFVFAQRLRSLYQQLQEIKTLQLRSQWRDNRPLYKLSNELEAVFSDQVLQRALTQMEPKMRTFDELREAMRIAPQSGSQGLNGDGMDTNIETIEGNVRTFRQRLADDPKRAADKDYQKMIRQIDKYWKKLFADPIQVDTRQGKVAIQPQRTNNIMERFFRDLKTGYRRKTGHNGMSRTFQSLLADTPLVKNLQNESYMKILLNEKPTLEARFAEIDIAAVRKQLDESQKSVEKIPATIKKLIAKPRFPQIVANIFRGNATHAALT